MNKTTLDTVNNAINPIKQGSSLNNTDKKASNVASSKLNDIWNYFGNYSLSNLLVSAGAALGSSFCAGIEKILDWIMGPNSAEGWKWADME